MFRYYKRNAVLALLAILFTILTQLSSPIIAVMEQRIIDIILSGKIASFAIKLIPTGIVIVLTTLFYWINAITQKKFQVRFEEQLRSDIFDGIMKESYEDFKKQDTAEQISLVKTHAATISNNFTKPLLTLIGYGIMAIVIMGIMFFYSIPLAILSVICAAFSAVWPLKFNKMLSNNLLNKLEKDAKLTFQLKEAMTGFETIRAFGILHVIQKLFAGVNREMADADYKTEVNISHLENVANVTQRITWFISFFAAGMMAVSGKITVGTMVMFTALFDEFNLCVTMYAQVIPIILSTKPDINRIISEIDLESNGFEGQEMPVFEKKLTIRDLSFNYADGQPIIEALNFVINKGEKVAIIGESGGGKSTFIKLIDGYYPNYSGEILYDGIELHCMDTKKLGKFLMIIHQNTFLFNESIRFNICLGEPFADEEIKEAMRRSGVDKFIDKIEGGIDGNCGENGSLLSGGQKQRIALARAFIRNVKFLILDEGVSAIDVETANDIEREILSEHDLTVITITHRIKDGLIEEYDRIYSMEHGSLREVTGCLA